MDNKAGVGINTVRGMTIILLRFLVKGVDRRRVGSLRSSLTGKICAPMVGVRASHVAAAGGRFFHRRAGETAVAGDVPSTNEERRGFCGGGDTAAGRSVE